MRFKRKKTRETHRCGLETRRLESVTVSRDGTVNISLSVTAPKTLIDCDFLSEDRKEDNLNLISKSHM